MKASETYEILEFAPADYFQTASLATIFPDHPERPAELDIGSGDGGFLLAMARHFPERNFLGVERLLGRVRRTARRALRSQLDNLRVLRLDSNYAVRWLLPPSSFSRIHFLFPDPWPKRRHHHRRQFQSGFLDAVHHLLVPGGEFLFKTDHPGYFLHAQTLASSARDFEPLPWSQGDFFYPETDFERQWQAQGKPIHAIRLRKSA